MGNRGERETREGVRVTGTTMNFMHVPNCETENPINLNSLVIPADSVRKMELYNTCTGVVHLVMMNKTVITIPINFLQLCLYLPPCSALFLCYVIFTKA